MNWWEVPGRVVSKYDEFRTRDPRYPWYQGFEKISEWGGGPDLSVACREWFLARRDVEKASSVTMSGEKLERLATAERMLYALLQRDDEILASDDAFIEAGKKK